MNEFWHTDFIRVDKWAFSIFIFTGSWSSAIAYVKSRWLTWQVICNRVWYSFRISKIEIIFVNHWILRLSTERTTAFLEFSQPRKSTSMRNFFERAQKLVKPYWFQTEKVTRLHGGWLNPNMIFRLMSWCFSKNRVSRLTGATKKCCSYAWNFKTK